MLSSAKKFWHDSSTTKKVTMVGGALVAGFIGYEAVEGVEGVVDHLDGHDLSSGGGGGTDSFSGGGGDSGGMSADE
jgi:hypothetical protein